jgi:large subunit ribosomal protein L9
MKVILLQDVHGIGAAGAVASVADGYARNFLIPRKLAVVANAGGLKDLERRHDQTRRRNTQEAKTAETLAQKIAGLSVTIRARAGEGNRLYGSVTNADIAEQLAAQGIAVDRHHIVIDHPIRMLGSHEVKVHLHREVDAALRLEVVSEESAG